MQKDDRLLVQAWCAGDPEAYAALILKHEKLLRRVAVVSAGVFAVKDEMLIDDILQDACIRLLKALKHYRGNCEPSTYMAGVVRNCALDAVRKHIRYQTRIEKAEIIHKTEAQYEKDVADAIITDLESERLITLLSKLEEPDRSLLYLKEAEGVELKELSAMFKIPLGTVKSKISRAKEKLRLLAYKEAN